MPLAIVCEWTVVSLVIAACATVAVESSKVALMIGVVAGAITVFVMGTLGLYGLRQRITFQGLIIRLIVTLAALAFLGAISSSLIGVRLPATYYLVMPFVATFAALVVMRHLLSVLMEAKPLKRRVLVYGAGRQAAQILGLRRRSDRRAFSVIGFVRVGSAVEAVPRHEQIDISSGLLQYCAVNGIDEIVVALDERREVLPIAEILECRLSGIAVRDIFDFLESETGRVTIAVVSPSWFLFSKGFNHDAFRKLARRLMDVLVTSILLLLTSPLMLIAMFAIRLEDGLGAEVIYRQRRVGLAGRVFEVLKLRTMRTNAEHGGRAMWATVNDPRVTRVGAVLRKTRLDELPQLLNVLAGQMSLVGPRPERPEFVSRFSETIPYYSERHIVKPGITGWAQVSYPYGASDEDALQKLQYDLYYIKHNSLRFDLSVLMQTVEVVLMGKGSR